MNKRSFLKSAAAFAAVPFVSNPIDFLEPTALKLKEFSDDKELWKEVQSHYILKDDYLNFESGYYNIIPQPTLNHFKDHIDHVNYHGSYYMRNHRFKDNRELAKKLADFVGCSAEELAITRNTTESLDTIISGFPWKEGDEAIYAIQDYGAMRVMFDQIGKRYGVTIKTVSVPNHPESDQQLVKLYEDQITPNTKMIHLSHMINITGHILPVQKICDMAHSYGVDVLVDGAHCVGHFDFNMDDLHCDYYGSSLHKWLATPLGLGLLYVNKDKMSKIWPLLGSHEKNPNKIRRLNHLGTVPVHTDLAISDALDYINWIGSSKKEKRLRAIQQALTKPLRNNPNIIINTPVEPHRSCAIANIGVKGIKPGDLAKTLLEDYNIFTVAIDGSNVHGCRITPNVFTTFEEVEKLKTALIKISKSV
jgi:selenocysteine lyase/cysteine desulfurase